MHPLLHSMNQYSVSLKIILKNTNFTKLNLLEIVYHNMNTSKHTSTVHWQACTQDVNAFINARPFTLYHLFFPVYHFKNSYAAHRQFAYIHHACIRFTQTSPSAQHGFRHTHTLKEGRIHPVHSWQIQNYCLTLDTLTPSQKEVCILYILEKYRTAISLQRRKFASSTFLTNTELSHLQFSHTLTEGSLHLVHSWEIQNCRLTTKKEVCIQYIPDKYRTAVLPPMQPHSHRRKLVSRTFLTNTAEQLSHLKLIHILTQGSIHSIHAWQIQNCCLTHILTEGSIHRVHSWQIQNCCLTSDTPTPSHEEVCIQYILV